MADFTDVTVQDFAQTLQATTVHEHDAIHELDVMFLTRGDDFGDVSGSAADGFFNEDMLAGLRGADDPFFAQSRGQRDVNGINVPAGEQRFVVVHRLRHDRMRRAGLAFGDERLRPRKVAAGHGDEGGVSGITNGLPVLAGDESGAENAPAAGCCGHESSV